MSADYAGQDPLDIAKQAERDLNSPALARGDNAPQSKKDTSTAQDADPAGGVNDASDLTSKFPSATVSTGGESSGRVIPPSQGGDTIIDTGATQASDPANTTERTTGKKVGERLTRDKDFEGEGGPEDEVERRERDNGGDDAVRGNIR